MMRIFNRVLLVIVTFGLLTVASSCNDEDPNIEIGPGGMPKNYGILEVDFELPEYQLIQKGIKRVDLALCYTMDSMYRGDFFFRTNVSDAKQLYQFQLPAGQYFYQAVITCTCGGDSCVFGGFPYGYGGLKYTFDKVIVENGEKTYSKPTFQ